MIHLVEAVRSTGPGAGPGAAGGGVVFSVWANALDAAIVVVATRSDTKIFDLFMSFLASHDQDKNVKAMKVVCGKWFMRDA